MNTTHMVRAGALGLAAFLVAGVAAAQVTSGVSVGGTPTTGSIAPGTGVNLGTVTLTGSETGATVTSVPVTFTPGGGATASNLSNCQLFNTSTNQAVSGAVNPGTGATTFTLNQATNVNNNGATYQIRCDVAGGTPTGATFGYTVGSPSLATALNVNLDTAPSVPAGAQDVALANIYLSGMNSGAGVNLSALPITVSAGNGASTAHLTDCRVRNTTNISGALNSSVPTIANGGVTNYPFTSALNVFAGSSQSLAYTCDVSAATPVGGTFTISLNPSGITATDALSGSAVTATPVVGTGPNGLPASTSGTVIVSAATGSGGNGGGDGTPGIPNTGAGGLAAQIALILALAATVAAGGAMYLRSQLAR